jgi:hypothetical protein
VATARRGETIIFVREEYGDEMTYVDSHGTFRCEACGREFDSREALRAHVRSVGLVD